MAVTEGDDQIAFIMDERAVQGIEEDWGFIISIHIGN